MIAKLETYAIIVAVAIAAGLGWGWHERFVQHKQDIADAAIALNQATAQVTALNQEINTLKTQRGDQYENVIRKIDGRVDSMATLLKPIRLCISAGSAAAPGVPNAGPATIAAPGGDGSNLRAGDDIRGPLYAFAGRCEKDRLHVIDMEDSLGELKRKGGEH